MSNNRKVENGILTFELEGVKFRVVPHTGRDAIKTRRLVRKLIAPQLAEQVVLMQQTEKAMPAADRERLAELRERYQALEGSTGPIALELETEIQKLINKHIDPAANAGMYKRMAESMNLEDEAFLDELVLKHTKALIPGLPTFQSLSDANAFDLAFAGERAELIDPVREEVIAFNGFLGSPPQTKPETPEAPAAATN